MNMGFVKNRIGLVNKIERKRMKKNPYNGVLIIDENQSSSEVEGFLKE